jgi:hypothetical protein
MSALIQAALETGYCFPEPTPSLVARRGGLVLPQMITEARIIGAMIGLRSHIGEAPRQAAIARPD